MNTKPTEGTKPEELPITPGEVHIEHGCLYFLNSGTPPQNRSYTRCTQGRNENGDWISMDECNANIALYADAHNTYRRTKVLPSVMAERLEEALKIIADNRNKIWQAYQETYRSIGLNYERACKRADEDTLPIDDFLTRTKPS